MALISHAKQGNTNPNPTKRFLEWKSTKKTFSYYDKEASENVEVSLPMKFLFIQQYHTVKGFHDASNSGIFSNEVSFIGKEPMNVRSFKGGPIASGLYSDIKMKVGAAGGNYHKSIYVMLEDGTLANISLKGSAVAKWSEFLEINKHLTDNQWIEVSGADAQKKGSVSYFTPTFVMGKALTKNEAMNVDGVVNTLSNYLTAYFDKSEEVSEPKTIEVEAPGLPF